MVVCGVEDIVAAEAKVIARFVFPQVTPEF